MILASLPELLKCIPGRCFPALHILRIPFWVFAVHMRFAYDLKVFAGKLTVVATWAFLFHGDKLTAWRGIPGDMKMELFLPIREGTGQTAFNRFEFFFCFNAAKFQTITETGS